MNQETWLPVVGYESCYEVSSAGNVRRSINRFGNPSGRPLKFGDRRGYKSVALSHNNKRKDAAIHRLVYEAFCGCIPEGMQINHKNGIKHDNNLENLEIVTPSENTAHGFRVLGRKAVKNPLPGSKNGMAKIKNEDVSEIFRLKSLGFSQQKIAAQFNVTQTTISRVLLGKSWKNAYAIS